MRKSPFYGRTLYGRANGLNAGFYIRKSPFMDGYYMAEQMTWRPKLLHKKESFYGQILHGRANGSKAETFTQERVLLRMDITWLSKWLEGQLLQEKEPLLWMVIIWLSVLLKGQQ